MEKFMKSVKNLAKIYFAKNTGWTKRELPLYSMGVKRGLLVHFNLLAYARKSEH